MPLQAQPVWGEATLLDACAPWDGPGFQIRATDQAGRTLVLEGFGANGQRAGVWMVKTAAELDKGTATLCPASSSVARCQFADAGQFTITAGGSGDLIVNFDLALTALPSAGRLKGSFKARGVASTRVCG